MRSSCLLALALCLLVLPLAGAALAQSASIPPPGAGYLLPDGSIRIVGPAELAGVIGKLDDLYTQQHPGTKFTYVPGNNLASIYSLEFDATAFAPTTAFFPGSLTYADIAHGPPFSVRMAHGSLQPGTQTSPYVVIVNAANPITHLTVGELASIFTQPLRQRVFSRWSQLGIRAALASAPIVACGLPWSDHFPSENTDFSDEFFTRRFGNAPPVDTYRGFKTYSEVGAFVAATPGAIGVTAANQVPAGVKVVGIVEGVFARPQTAAPAEIAAGHYPLDRYLYLNVHAVSGKPLDPLVLDYLRMVLSPVGQQVIAAQSSGYIPLTATEMQEDLARLQ
jgi:phosphate transport system substrate-binding protein